jgi:hypothetical protein
LSRSAGRALVVGSAACRAQARVGLARTPYEFAAAEEAYSAALELCRRPLAYRVVVLCLNSIYREELALISMIKRRLRHIDVYVSQTEGRQTAYAEAMRIGADGTLADDGLHRAAAGAPSHSSPIAPPPAIATAAEISAGEDENFTDTLASGEAVLTSDELRALLQDQPTLPPSQEG